MFLVTTSEGQHLQFNGFLVFFYAHNFVINFLMIISYFFLVVTVEET